MEENLVELCMSLINPLDCEVGYAVVANLSASSMIQLARKLATDSNAVKDEERAEVQAMLTEAKAALEQRNKILHASVGELMFEGKTAFRHRTKKGPGASGPQPRWETTLRGLEELDEIGARLFRVSEDLWGYVNLPAEEVLTVLPLEPEQAPD
ncbi:hypothetical protein IV500_18470 [Paeniglutamicibacter antarcticus]|uniref:Uncharacterized protein n=1 Tax=Arthrobacter terrae TaxID=2935737 RepID=A0A931CMK2_9MICC|nr:hypothetical protein [Arthrobacter terrae]MBG0741352.1 hypothetical protein [Arthrobacter terrae]